MKTSVRDECYFPLPRSQSTTVDKQLLTYVGIKLSALAMMEHKTHQHGHINMWTCGDTGGASSGAGERLFI